MRNASFIFTFALMLAAPSIAGSSDQNLPGAGTFRLSGDADRDLGVAGCRGGQVSVDE